MRIFSRALTAIAGWLALTTIAEAAYQHPMFDPARGGSVCYARKYSAAFLKKNPNVTITTVSLERRNTTATGVPNKASNFRIVFGATTKAENYTADAYCKSVGKHVSCNVESDGGTFTLHRVGKSLIIKTRRIEIEGFFKELAIVSGKNKPTRSFTLFGNGKKTCAAVFD
jgi:hypothetical protein